MRIGIDARTLTEVKPSGVTIYAYHIIRAMVQLAPQDDFILFISGYNARLGERSLLQILGRYPNVTVKQLHWPNKIFHSLTLLGLAPTVDRFLGKVDVLFVPNLHILRVAQRCPIVLTVHDLSHVLFPECLSWRRRLWHRAVNVPKLVQRAQHLIAVSDTTKHDLMKLYHLADDRITTIYPGVPASGISSSVALVKLPSHYAVVLATLEPRKNILATIQAFQKYRHAHPDSQLELVVVGGVGWKSRQVLQALHSRSDIHYYGYVTDEQKQQVLQQAHILIYPSLYEGFGFPPLEALRYNVPTIAGNAGAMPEIMQAAAYYVQPYSVAELAEAINLVDRDTVLRGQLLNARQTVLQRYNWTKSAQATLEVLRQAAFSTSLT